MKLKVVLAGIVALGIAGGGTYTMFNKQEVQSQSIVKGESPTERTIDMKGNYPWQWATPEKLTEWINEGEVVFLRSDGDALESTLTTYLSENPTVEVDKSLSAYINAFVEQLTPYNQNTAYLNVMKEVSKAIASSDYETALVKIEEAKNIN